MAFRTGSDAAKEASKGGSFAKNHYFSLEDGGQAILRFLTDFQDWIVVDQHQMIPTKAKPADWPKDATWPEKMGAVCRNDIAFRNDDGSRNYPDCFICDHVVGTGDGQNKIKKPAARSWAYAVLREEVIENGEVVGIRDQTREVNKVDKDGKPTGETVQEKAIVIVNMGFKNFFSALDGFGKHYKTVLDRDYLIKRDGKGTDTAYPVIPLDPIVGSDGVVFDLRLPQYKDRYKPAEPLGDVVTERSSDEFFARFFDTRVAAPPTKQRDGAATEAVGETAKAGNDADPDAIAAMAARVKGYSSGGAASANDTPATEDAPATASPAKATAGMRNFDE